MKIPLALSGDDARRRIEERGYRVVGSREFESDQVYDRSDQELRRTGQLLRLRSARGGWTLTYKGPARANSIYKSREEIETTFTSAEEAGQALEYILAKLGYTPSWRYEKYRTAFQDDQDGAGKIFLDETPIGVFLELEGAEDWIDRTASRLGYSTSDYVTRSYASLYSSYLELHDGPADMLFSR